jgi:hypothetical protein
VDWLPSMWADHLLWLYNLVPSLRDLFLGTAVADFRDTRMCAFSLVTGLADAYIHGSLGHVSDSGVKS